MNENVRVKEALLENIFTQAKKRGLRLSRRQIEFVLGWQGMTMLALFGSEYKDLLKSKEDES